MTWKILVPRKKEEIYYSLKTAGYFQKNRKDVVTELGEQMTNYL